MAGSQTQLVDLGMAKDGRSESRPPHLRDISTELGMAAAKSIQNGSKGAHSITSKTNPGSEVSTKAGTAARHPTKQQSDTGQNNDGGMRYSTQGSHPSKPIPINPGTLRKELEQGVLKPNVPAQDWFDEPEIPTSAEIGRIVAGAATGEAKPIHPNNIHAPWSSREEYLKTLYGLFREDGMGPLRDCVDEIRETPSLDEATSELKARIYESVYITGVTLCRKGLVFKVEFTTRRSGKRIHWPVSSRLKSGNAVALTPARDCFKSICKVAVVVARPLIDLEVEPPGKPAVHIEFGNPNEIEIDPQQEWLMVEASSAYWEATRHTLGALQSMRDEEFPLSQHILDLHPKAKAPSYSDTTAILALAASENEKLTEENGHGLDASQEAALRQILTKSVAVVQGPPGTGKTYVSVVAIRLLLDAVKVAGGPIVVTAHTNHALDQLLRHIAQFEPEFIRLGGQSSDKEVIVPRTLPILREQQTKTRKASRAEPLGIEKQVKRELDELITVLGQETPLPLAAFQKAGLLSETQCTELAEMQNEWGQTFNNSEDPISIFCTDQITPFRRRGQGSLPTLWEDIDDVDVQVEDADLTLGIEDDRFEELHGKFMPIEAGFTPRFERFSAAKVDAILLKYARKLTDIPEKYRGSIYEHFRQKAMEQIRDRLRIVGWDCKRMAQMFKLARWEADYHLLMGARVVGMTTTGLSKYRPLVKALRPKIVLVEEAAETLEPSVIPAFMPSVEHVILVGDHQQLRGHCNLRELEGKPFHLDVSMFERLVLNNMDFAKLQLQRRMRPEIREIIAPIYPDLADHKSVLQRPNIPGMGGINTGFVHHEFPEASDDQLSKVNNGEALFVVMFCKYLLDNGIGDNRITILTFYNGQRKLLLRLLARHIIAKVRVATVDSFQGEENDIVLLSLVRCNDQHQIGFLTVDNRVCVALSRAKLGFFIFGHVTDVYQRSELWRKVCNILETRQTLFASLPLVCTNHGTRTWVASGNVLQELNGGCSEECGGKMPCGHRCPLKCHPLPHEQLKCQEPCTVELPCGHPCRYLCWSEIHACVSCVEQRKEEAREEKEKTFALASLLLTTNTNGKAPAQEDRARRPRHVRQRGEKQGEQQTQPQNSSKRVSAPAPARGRRAYHEFAANGSPPKQDTAHDSELQRLERIETAATALANDRIFAAGSAGAALEQLTSALASSGLATDAGATGAVVGNGTGAGANKVDHHEDNEMPPRARQVWTHTWVDPAVELRTARFLREAAEKEKESEQANGRQPLVNLLN